MAINFAAANTAGLNNPGTEIITLVKDGSGNFINPPSYDKMRAYLSSGEVPMLFVTAEGGETGSLYQFVEYSETENKIRFGNSTNAIEFCAGAVAPAVSNVVPKPLTYDYMPEGYPKKTMGSVTLMEEQEVAFTENSGKYVATLASGLSLVEGQTYTVNWDGTEYECVSRKFNNILVIGNLSIFGLSENSGEPFLYVMSGKTFSTLDTSASHTISVKTTREVVTTMAEEFLPNISAPFIVNVWATNRQQTVFECDKTISEFQAAIESKTSITLRYRESVSNESDFVIYNLSQFSIADNGCEFHHIELNTTGIRLRTFYIRLENGNVVITRTSNNIVTSEATTA